MTGNTTRFDGRETARKSNDGTERETNESVTRRRFLQTAAVAGTSTLALGAAGSVAAQSREEEACELWDEIQVSDGVTLFNNMWSMQDSQQCIFLNDDGSYGYEFTARGGGDEPNYPQMFVGSRPWGEDSGASEFPLPRGEIDELVLEWDVDVNITGGEWNLAEEWWLLSGQPASSDPPLEYEIMLVLDYAQGEHSHGGTNDPGAITDQFGNTIDFWTVYPGGGGTSAGFYIFKLAQPSQSGKVDLTAIIDYMSTNEGVGDHLTFTGVELGDEYWANTQGDVTFNTANVTINGNTYTSGSGGGSEPVEPEQPQNLEVTSTSQNSVQLQWNGSEDSYNVYVDGSQETTTSSTSATISGLQPNSSYGIEVRAVASDGTESDAATVTAQTDAEQTTGCGDDEIEVADGVCAADENGDGYYRDVDGSGSTGSNDVVEFFQNFENSAISNNPDAFDYNDSGSVGFDDVVELFNQV